MDEVKAQIRRCVNFDPDMAPSVYLSGRRGCGKTSLLTLLGRYFHENGYQVYFFDAASAIPHGIGSAFKLLLENQTQKVAVLVDELETNPTADLFTTLLKGTYPHLVTIGAAIPRYTPSGMAAKFATRLSMSDIVLRETDDDFLELINYWVLKDAASRKVTKMICKHVLDECSGHTYPTLKFIEYVFMHAPPEVRESKQNFREYFGGPKFVDEEVYKFVIDRCFNISDTEATTAAIRVLGGKQKATDVISLTRVGW